MRRENRKRSLSPRPPLTRKIKEKSKNKKEREIIYINIIASGTDVPSE